MAKRPMPDGAPELTGVAHLADLIRTTVPPLHPAGIPFVGGALLAAALSHRIKLLRNLALALAAFCALFFRHPRRVPPSLPGAVVSPADGTVSLVDTAVPPSELNLGSDPRPRVSVFLSVVDVHVQFSPVAGRVRSVVHQPGAFLSADLPEASDRNERTSMLLHTDAGQEIAVVQIAGLIARRIVCHAQPGDVLELGHTYGLIRFGSRVDVYFPAGTQPLVEVGQRTVGAETILAVLR